MANLALNSSQLGSALRELLMADDIEPGSDIGYQLCKIIYTHHPLGGKLAEKPVDLAMSQPRGITVQNSPGDVVKNAFIDQWRADGHDGNVRATAVLARVYGVSSLAMLAEDIDPAAQIDEKALADLALSFNIFDPLNTAGSLVLDQNPNSMTFQKHRGIAVNGKAYHRSRSVTLMNERPIYLSYSSSAFGFVGRSVYQRALFPMKTFVQTMIADDMVARKAGVLIAKLKQQGSIVDQAMKMMAGVKRQLLREAQTENVLSITPEEAIESLNLLNLEGPLAMARRNCLENSAAANNMPAKMMTEESLSSSFNEGTEEAKQIVQYVDGVREWLQPVYDFLDPITMRRAWTPTFFESVKAQFPDAYGSRDYESVFYEWANSFEAIWPSLIREPESEKVDVSKKKMEAAVAVVEVMLPQCDQANKAILLQWLADTISSDKVLFPSSLVLDWEALAEHIETPIEAEEEPNEPAPFASHDHDGARLQLIESAVKRAMA